MSSLTRYVTVWGRFDIRNFGLGLEVSLPPIKDGHWYVNFMLGPFRLNICKWWYENDDDLE